MSGVFRGGGRPLSAEPGEAYVPAAPVGVAATAVKPDPVAAPAPAAGLGETRAPVTRAATMLSNRRAGDDVRVGTKKLLGQ